MALAVRLVTVRCDGEPTDLRTSSGGAVNDRLALEHPIDDYYTHASLPIRVSSVVGLPIIRELHRCRADALDDRRGRLRGRACAPDVPSRRGSPRSTSRTDLPRHRARESERLRRAASSRARSTSWTSERELRPRDPAPRSLEHVVDPDAVLGAIGSIPASATRCSGRHRPERSADQRRSRISSAGDPARCADAGARSTGCGDEYHLTCRRKRRTSSSRFSRRYFRVGRKARLLPSAGIPLRACFKCVLEKADR